jgi:hypothetical protein
LNREPSATSPKEYRELMDEALRWASSARTESERDSFLQIAKAWHEAAMLLERSMGLVDKSNELLKE